MVTDRSAEISAAAELLRQYCADMACRSVVTLGKLLSDPTRVHLLNALLDGRAYTVTELHRHVGVAASTASEHLGKLLDGGLVAIEAQGRHRYYRLNDPSVSELLESMMQVGEGLPVKRSSRVPVDMAYARSCHDHIAGTIAVGFTDHLEASGAVAIDDDGVLLSKQGRVAFHKIGVDVNQTPRSMTRPELRRCLDWSERRPHLAGAIPAQFLQFVVDERWFIRKPMSRALELTDRGRTGFRETFGYCAP